MAENTQHPALSDETKRQFAPYGTMRIGLAVGSAISAVWTTRDEGATEPRGVTVDLGAALARHLGLPFEYVNLASSGEIISTAEDDRWDVSFTPVDADRKKVVDFSTDYYLGDSTYMVHRDAPFGCVADVDAEGVRVVGVEDTATIRSARRTLTRTTAEGLSSLEDAIQLFRAGEADAIALGRESLMSLAETLPDGRILDDHFHATGTALAMPKGRAEALEIATAFIEDAKASGLLGEIVSRHGLRPQSIAPAGART